MTGKRILVIEDDTSLNSLICEVLQNEGYTVDTCIDGEEGLSYILTNSHDLVIMDLMLPSLDGISLMKTVRKAGIAIPVIMSTALGMTDDRINGLDAGADDYIVKPYDIRELLARVRALCRRSIALRNELLEFGDIVLHTEELKLVGQLGESNLAKREADMFGIFFENPNRVLTRDYLYNHIWGFDADVEYATLDIYIHFIRRHLRMVSNLVVVTTIRKSGYIMELTNDHPS